MTTTIAPLFELLRQYLQPQRRRVLLLTILLTLSIGLQLVNPQIVRYVLDTATSGATTSILILMALLFIVFAVGQKIATVFASYVGENVSWTATNALRADLAAHCLRLDMDFHNAHTPGELIERVDGDASELANLFSHLVLRVAANGLLILGVVLLLLREDWRMGVAGLLYALLLLFVLQLAQKRNVRFWSAARQALAGFNGFLEERLSGREDVRANGGEAHVLRGLALFQYEAFQAHYRARLFGDWMFGVTHMLFVLATALGLGLGIYLYLEKQITIGTVYLVVYYLAILRDPLEQIRDQIKELQQSTASVMRIRALFQIKPAVLDQGERSLPFQRNEEKSGVAVSFEQVSFRYAGIAAVGNEQHSEQEERPSVLEEVSFSLNPGEVMGLLGRTGSGKTTLSRLLFRLYEPTAGRILLDHTELPAINLRDLRRQIGVVTQEVQLFQATLRDNITLFNSLVTDEQILRVTEQLGLHSWLSAQPAGLDTLLQSGGAGLSAGEAQLLAFVRVFLKDPGLVILDEASSRLDPVTEQVLKRATDRLLQNRTGIIIAHRLTTLERVDTILILENGRVAEYGSRYELAQDPASRYYDLLQTGLAEDDGGSHE